MRVGMHNDDTQIRILRRAMAFSGGREALARELGVTHEDIDDWLSGATAPDAESYLAATELVAFSEQRRTRPARRSRR